VEEYLSERHEFNLLIHTNYNFRQSAETGIWNL